MNEQNSTAGDTPSALIDGRIAELGDWRGDMLAKVRKTIHQAVPDVTEDWKWRGVPTWESDGILCTGESYTSYLKLTFPKGAQLDDPKGLFNASLEGNARRAIDLHEGAEARPDGVQGADQAGRGTERRGRRQAHEEEVAPTAAFRRGGTRRFRAVSRAQSGGPR